MSNLDTNIETKGESIKIKSINFFLKNTGMPVAEIAKEVGYENQGFFYKKFQEYYGMSPAEYRKS